MTERILQELRALEEAENVRIIYACESGSRAWGFASTDSDWDVRFLYVHPMDWYLAIDTGRDVIERPISEALDIKGWDLRKALCLFRKSNPSLLEWLRSPIVYRESPGVTSQIRKLASEYYSPKGCMYHYRRMAETNCHIYLQGETVPQKKYFYVLRPILACNWLEADRGPVPVEFAVLVENLVSPGQMKEDIAKLVRRKKQGIELEATDRIPSIDAFIERELARLPTIESLRPAYNSDKEPLNRLFRSTLQLAWQ